MNIDSLVEDIINNLKYTRSKTVSEADERDVFYSLSASLKKMVQDRMQQSSELYDKSDVKRIYYISIEFLVGDSLENNLVNLGIYKEAAQALSKIGFDLDEVVAVEKEAALGTGGLGRLAACFLDSLTTMGIPGYGYGINYEFGSLRQEIVNGFQVEKPDGWQRDEFPWFIRRYGHEIKVPVFGHLEKIKGDNEFNSHVWTDYNYIIGIPNDMPVVGYGGDTVNYLRLYTSAAPDELNFEKFYYGNYLEGTSKKNFCERISKIIYPSDSTDKGRELRLLQEYFLSACAIRDIITQFEATGRPISEFSSRVAIQINDTHPSLAIVELMRILVDEKGISWETALNITRETFCYTNHTLLPEALEKWPVYILEKVVPRHLDIIYEINKHFLNRIENEYNGDIQKLRKMSIFEESETKYVRMTNLSIICSHSVNGVSELHSELVKKTLVPDFYDYWPEKFNNKTNGITQRRWLLKANPNLAQLITEKIGDSWIRDLFKLRELENYIDDTDFQTRFSRVKNDNKKKLAEFITESLNISVNTDSIFDVQIKRIHEYKRQLLNVLNIINTYFSIIEDGKDDIYPRTFIFSGKSAPGYFTAKKIIKLINNVAKIINNDSRVKDLIKVVFIPNYNVRVAEITIPACDVSEQISTAGKEASGTGNMKFCLNGSVIIGTLDGANVEIREEVGDENIYIFGKTSDEISLMNRERSYNPVEYYQNDMNIKRIMDSLNSNLFCPGEQGLFKFLYDTIINKGDYYYHLADFDSYVETQKTIGTEFNKKDWTKKSILNVARIGKFSSDRTIGEYASELWGVKPVIVKDS